jgi:hypothetical protein
MSTLYGIYHDIRYEYRTVPYRYTGVDALMELYVYTA